MCVKDTGRKASSEVITNEKTKKSKSWIWLNGLEIIKERSGKK